MQLKEKNTTKDSRIFKMLYTLNDSVYEKLVNLANNATIKGVKEKSKILLQRWHKQENKTTSGQ